MPTPEQIQQWKDQYKEVYLVTVEGKEFYFRHLTRSEYKRHLDTVRKSTYDSSYTLLITCLLEPSPAEMNVLIEQKPGLVITIINELQEPFGITEDASLKKL